MSFGGTPRCERCGGAVYHAEQVMGPGRKIYHKLCLKCEQCGKRLDSGSLVQHDNAPYCARCHTQLFGTRDLRHANLHTTSPARAPRPPPEAASPSSTIPRTATGAPAARAVPPPQEYYTPPDLSATTTPEVSSRTVNGNSGTRDFGQVHRISLPLTAGGSVSVSPARSGALPSSSSGSVSGLGSSSGVASGSASGTFSSSATGASTSASYGGGMTSSPRTSRTPRVDSPPVTPERTRPNFRNDRPIPAGLPPSSSQQNLNFAAGAAPGSPTGPTIPAVLNARGVLSRTDSPRSKVGLQPGFEDRCHGCEKRVYAAEQVNAIGFKWHRGCLRCSSCKTTIDPNRVSDRDGAPWCKNCYAREHGPEGIAGKR